MPSLGSVLGAARSALAAHQHVIQTAGHNIANAETPGFSRQRVELRPGFEQREPTGSLGTGVVVADLRRARDVLLDVAVRQEDGGEAAASTRQELLAAIEDVVSEPSDTGLAATFDALWSSWSDLAAAPTSRAARAVAVERAGAAATALNTADARLADLRQHTELRVANTLAQLNGLAARVAELNARVAGTEAGGGRQANDLRDQRDVAVDELAKLAGAAAAERPDGTVHVTLGGYTLVDGIHAKALARTTDAHGRTALAMADAPGRALRAVGGSTQAMLDVLNTDLQAAQDQLDATANGLARAVNAVHALGRTADGTPGGAAGAPVFVDRTAQPPADPVYDPAASPFARPLAKGAVTARTIAVNAALEADPARVAATSSAARPTGNDVALAMAALRTNAAVTVGEGAGAATVAVTFVLPDRSGPPGRPDLAASAPTTLADFHRSAATALAVRVQDAEGDAAVRAALAEQARGRREALVGVNVDEELTTLMRAQQAYAAAAKVVTAADEMMQSLLAML